MVVTSCGRSIKPASTSGHKKCAARQLTLESSGLAFQLQLLSSGWALSEDQLGRRYTPNKKKTDRIPRQYAPHGHQTLRKWQPSCPSKGREVGAHTTQCNWSVSRDPGGTSQDYFNVRSHWIFCPSEPPCSYSPRSSPDNIGRVGERKKKRIKGRQTTSPEKAAPASP